MVQFPVESLLLSSESWCMQDFVCALQEWSPYFPQWKSCSQIPLAFKVRFPGDSQTLCQVPGLEAWCGVQNLNKSGKTSLVLLFFNLSPTRWTWDLIIVILPLLLSHCGFFLVFGRGVSFFGGFWGPPVGGCSLFNS